MRAPKNSGKRGRPIIALLLALMLVLAACGGEDDPAATGTDDDGAADEADVDGDEPSEESEGDAEVTGPIEGRPEPAGEADDELRIAMIGFGNNPYWVVVQDGAEMANEVLSDYNGSVEWINAGSTIDVPTVDAAVRAAANQGYDGVGFFIAGEGNCQAIQELSDQGIALGAYNTLIDCVEDSGGVINYAQEQYDAGQLAAERMIELTGDAEGTVGIITSQFTAPGAEQRRTGFIDGLEGSNLTPVNEGVEARDSASETFGHAQSFIQSQDNLLGLYATAGGPFGAAEAVESEGRSDDITVIGYDITPENLEVLRNGSLDGVIGQDAFGQGYNVAVELFNFLVTGERPDQVLQPAFSPFVSSDNLEDHDPELQPLGTLGTS